MIYEIKSGDLTFEVDDTVLLDNQSKAFRRVFNELVDENNIAVFDNATLMLTSYGRVLINAINDHDDE